MLSRHAKHKKILGHDLGSTQSWNAQKNHLKNEFSNIMGNNIQPYVNLSW
jgi:hypothetical protein